ncbi:testisin-like isoform X1 [Artemia franciscana]|uniref:testisin-like isoform X1 n=1 Tax=Artemia franciscana TaxID=6661 RepID=UPI0032DA8282
MHFNMKIIYIYIIIGFSDILAILFNPKQSIGADQFSSPCGIRFLPTQFARIVGGQTSKPGEIPWIAYLESMGQTLCGATILSERWVITAAHCMMSPSNFFRVVAGQVDTQIPTPYTQFSIPLFAARAPGFNGGFSSDIALVRLATPFRWSNYVQPICLPYTPLDGGRGLVRPFKKGFRSKTFNNTTKRKIISKEFSNASNTILSKQDEELLDIDDDLTEDFPSATKGIIAGWGWLDEQGTVKTTVLQQLEIPVIGPDECREWYKSGGYPAEISDNLICAGIPEGGKDACLGDSGGPLVLEKHGRFELAGVIAGGQGCARPGLPGVYVNIEKFLPWIRSMIRF